MPLEALIAGQSSNFLRLGDPRDGSQSAVCFLQGLIQFTVPDPGASSAMERIEPFSLLVGQRLRAAHSVVVHASALGVSSEVGGNVSVGTEVFTDGPLAVHGDAYCGKGGTCSVSGYTSVVALHIPVPRVGPRETVQWSLRSLVGRFDPAAERIRISGNLALRGNVNPWLVSVLVIAQVELMSVQLPVPIDAPAPAPPVR